MRFLLFFLIFSSLSVFAQLSPMHTFKLSDEELDDYKVNGSVEMSHCLAEGYTKINGSLKATNRCLFEALAVNGECFLQQCMIKGCLYVRGPLTLDYTLAQEEILVEATEVYLYQSRTADITMKRSSKPGTQRVHLKKGTNVDGNIVFEGKSGEVLLYRGAKFLGATVGGKIIRLAQEE